MIDSVFKLNINTIKLNTDTRVVYRLLSLARTSYYVLTRKRICRILEEADGEIGPRVTASNCRDFIKMLMEYNL